MDSWLSSGGSTPQAWPDWFRGTGKRMSAPHASAFNG